MRMYLSVGHPRAFADAGFPQVERCWYTLLFQFEGVAEEWLSTDGFAVLRTWARHPDPDAVAATMSEPGALTASINGYRANLGPRRLVDLDPPLEYPPIAAPTMVVWSTDDPMLVEASVVGSKAYVTGPFRYERLEGVGHWISLEAPDELNALLLDFLET